MNIYIDQWQRLLVFFSLICFINHRVGRGCGDAKKDKLDLGISLRSSSSYFGI